MDLRHEKTQAARPLQQRGYSRLHQYQEEITRRDIDKTWNEESSIICVDVVVSGRGVDIRANCTMASSEASKQG
jgi:hypothetical protein